MVTHAYIAISSPRTRAHHTVNRDPTLSENIQMIYVDQYALNIQTDTGRQTNQANGKANQQTDTKRDRDSFGCCQFEKKHKKETGRHVQQSLIPSFSIYLSLSFLFCRLVDIDLSISLSLSFCSNKLPLFSLIGVLFLVNKTTKTSSTAGENKTKKSNREGL